MTVTVRPAVPDDAPAMAAILNRIIAIGGTTAHQSAFTAERAQSAYITGPKVVCSHVALDGTGQVIGFQSVDRHDGLPEGWGDVGTFVQPGLQARGTGAALFAATQAAARAAGLTTINATIRADNTPGLAFYARAGFLDYESNPDWALADGRVVGRISRRFDL